MVETGHPYVTSMRQNLPLNLPDKYEIVLGSVRHRSGFGRQANSIDKIRYKVRRRNFLKSQRQ